MFGVKVQRSRTHEQRGLLDQKQLIGRAHPQGAVFWSPKYFTWVGVCDERLWSRQCRANDGYSRYRFSLKGPGMRSTQKRLRPPLTHDGTTGPVMIVETWLNISDGYKRHKVEGVRVGYSNTEFFYISTFLYFLGFLFLIPWGVLKQILLDLKRKRNYN